MKRAWPLLATAALLVLAFVVGAYAQATGQLRTFLPLVMGAQAQTSICDGSNPIQETDTGALSAARQPDGSYDLAYQNRQDGGGRLHVAKHIGDHLEEIAAPALTQVPSIRLEAPPFSPDGPKQGAAALVPAAEPGGESRVYFTQRKPGATSGPYMIYCTAY